MQVDMLFFWKSLPARLIDNFTMALHTCDTLRWYQRPLYARIEQRESTQNGESQRVAKGHKDRKLSNKPLAVTTLKEA